MGKLPLLAVLAFAACQPMYGDPAPKLKNPAVVPVAKRAIKPDPVPDKPKPIEDCEYRTKPVVGTKLPKRDVPRSQEYVVKADSKIATADRTEEPKVKGDLLIDSIQEYGAALDKDPYNAEATLKLALAYDKVLRKGCALRLLGRLGKLAANPTFERAANEKLDDIENHKSWFGDYRKEALQAGGRISP